MTSVSQHVNGVADNPIIKLIERIFVLIGVPSLLMMTAWLVTETIDRKVAEARTDERLLAIERAQIGYSRRLDNIDRNFQEMPRYSADQAEDAHSDLRDDIDETDQRQRLHGLDYERHKFPTDTR